MKFFDIPTGMEIELVAAEPQIIDPIAIRFDAQGRMWVVEMNDYPSGTGVSRVKLLEDLDSDGTFETAHLFADDLVFATGLQPWKDGVIVTMAGQVAYLKDTDGDHQADQREVWYSGFAQDNQQLRANHPRLGVDQRVYVANGLRGGIVQNVRQPDSKPLNISGMDFMFDPETGACETVSGNGQYGLTFDDIGNRYVCSNRNPAMRIMIEDRYIKRYPSVPVLSVKKDVVKAGQDSAIYPLTRFWTTSNLHEGQFTAACGVMLYRGHQLPWLKDAILTCDPTGNLIHAEKIQSTSTDNSRYNEYGPYYYGTPTPEREFLASKDHWFRAVSMRTGPDGCLYIVDMHRAVIEHPQWVPDELKDRKDARSGDDKGRIYRLKPTNARLEPKWNWSIENHSVEELVLLLEHQNSWQRDTAMRLLAEQRPEEAVGLLGRLLNYSREPVARVLALRLLHGWDKLEDAQIMTAASHYDRRLRVNACIVLEDHWSNTPQQQTLARKLLTDRESAVRFQAIFSFGDKVKHDSPTWNGLVKTVVKDEYTTQAFLMASADDIGNVAAATLKNVLSTGVTTGEQAENVYRLYGLAARRMTPEQQSIALQWIAELPKWANEGAVAIGDVRAARAMLESFNAKKIDWRSQIEMFPEQKKVSFNVLWMLARQWINDGEAAEELKREALQLLALGQDAEFLLELFYKTDFSHYHVDILGLLHFEKDLAVWGNIISRFPSMAPAVKRALVDVVLRDLRRTQMLLTELEMKTISVNEIDATRMNKMTGSSNAEIAKRAKALQTTTVNADRAAVLADYQSALQLKPFPREGEKVFRQNCATCHRIGKIGNQVAPDISDSRTRQPLQILTDILQPNKAID
ncbi:MAG: PVC-type heme-binding CxxCH protein, partial [Planctomycetota bacterium]|nr:PVC-type heme-binding CxxCH protein [Planctomycetota bacterium]